MKLPDEPLDGIGTASTVTMKPVDNSFALFRWVRTAKPADPSVEFGSKEHHLLMILATHVDPTKPGPLKWKTGIAELVKESYWSDKSVRRALGNLEKAGLIQVSRSKRSNSDNEPNVYALLIPVDWEQSHEDAPPRVTVTPGVGSDRPQGWGLCDPQKKPEETTEESTSPPPRFQTPTGGGHSPSSMGGRDPHRMPKAEKPWEPDAQQKRLARIFQVGDRHWTPREEKAYQTGLASLNGHGLTEANLDLLERWVAAKPEAQLDDFAATLERLNGQLERAEKWAARGKPTQRATTPFRTKTNEQWA